VTVSLALSACDNPVDDYPELPPCFDELVSHRATLSDDRDNCGACGIVCSKDDMCRDSQCIADRNWALWSIGSLPRLTQTYQVMEDVVLDKTTGLEWQRLASSEPIPMKETRAYCEDLELAGGRWHLPTRIELLSIVDFSRYSPATNTEVFVDTPSAEFKHERWGLTAASHSDSSADQIHFADGSQLYFPNQSDIAQYSGSHYVRCVRASMVEQPMGEHYAIEADTVLDNKTGLRWQRVASAQCTSVDCRADNQARTWEDAGRFCADLVLGDYDDFRVPTLPELLTLVDPFYPYGSLRFDRDAFPEEVHDMSDAFYSSTPTAVDPRPEAPWPWVIRFGSGQHYRDVGATRVRCVRSDASPASVSLSR
jgi:hypothetical protein